MEYFPRPCIYYFTSACPHEEKEPGLTAHEKGCDYRPVRCPDTKCQKVLPLNEITEHLQEDAHLRPEFSDYEFGTDTKFEVSVCSFVESWDKSNGAVVWDPVVAGGALHSALNASLSLRTIGFREH